MAGLQYISRAAARRHLSFSGGVKIRDGSLDPRLTGRYRTTRELASWTARFTQSVFWERDGGVGAVARLEFERGLTPSSTFRSSFRTGWSESAPGMEWSQTLSVRRRFSHRHAAALAVQVGGHTRPEAVVDAYTAALEHRALVHRDWLFLDATARGRFPRERDFRFTPELALGLEIVF